MPLNTLFDFHSNPKSCLNGTVYAPNSEFEMGGTPTSGCSNTFCDQIIVNTLYFYGNSSFNSGGCSFQAGRSRLAASSPWWTEPRCQRKLPHRRQLRRGKLETFKNRHCEEPQATKQSTKRRRVKQFGGIGSLRSARNHGADEGFWRFPAVRRFMFGAEGVDGAALLEFTIMAPILIGLSVYTADSGLLFYNKMEMQNAAQAGAQWAIANRIYNPSEIQVAAQEHHKTSGKRHQCLVEPVLRVLGKTPRETWL